MAAGAGFMMTSYATYAGLAWWRYGQVSRNSEEGDALLDRFMPSCEVAERHHVRISAPADITFAAATEMNLQRSPIVRGIFRAREVIMGSRRVRAEHPQPFLAEMRAIGWGVLAESPGREIVMGAVTQPWVADVVFHPLPPDEFSQFNEPGFVKIAWTLRVDEIGPRESIFRTETRVVATDPTARARFRRYWALASPGIIAIRWMLLNPLKADAEARAKAAQ